MREQGFLQADMRDIIAGKQRAEHECSSPESPIVHAYLLFRQAQAAVSDIRLQEKGDNLHDKALAKTVQDDERDVQPDVLLCKELADDSTEFTHDDSGRPVPGLHMGLG